MMSIPESLRLNELKSKGFYDLNRAELTEYVGLAEKSLEMHMDQPCEAVNMNASQNEIMVARERLDKNWV